MVFESLDGSFICITDIDIQGDNLVRNIFLKDSLLEDITSFVFHDLEIGLLASSCEYVDDFWTSLLMHAPDLDVMASVKIASIS